MTWLQFLDKNLDEILGFLILVGALYAAYKSQ